MDIQSLRSQAVGRLQDTAQDGKARANAMLEGVALAATEFAERFEGDSAPARFVQAAATTVGDWSQALQAKSVDELLDDGRDAVRRSPKLAIGLAATAGFVLSRFLKASARR